MPDSIALDAIPTGSSNATTVCLNANSNPIINPISSDPIVIDQRGVARPQGSGCDIGAYEAILLNTATTPAAASAQATDSSVPLSVTVTVPTCPIPNNACPPVNEGTVTFSVTDSSSNPVGSDVQGAVTDGTASADFTPNSSLLPGHYNIAASYHDPNSIFRDSQGTSTLTVTAGPPASLTLSPGDTTAAAGSTVTETATVTDANGNPVTDGTVVYFTVSGVNPTSGSAATVNGQAVFSYTGALAGKDTLTATAEGGSRPNDSAIITWTAPASAPRVSLTILNWRLPQVNARIVTGASGSTPAGTLSYRDRAVRLSQVQFQSLVVARNTATLFGTATLSDGTPVSFRLDVSQKLVSGWVRLRLSTGYDSGSQPVIIVSITSSTFTRTLPFF